MAKFVVAEEGHVINALPPVDIDAAGASTDVFSMKGVAHASIIVTFGAAVTTTITVLACDDFTPSNTSAIAFNVYKEETAAGDTLGVRTAVTSSGFATHATADNIMYVIEIDAEELAASGYPNLQVAFSNPSTTTLASCVVILSGLTQGYQNTAIA